MSLLEEEGEEKIIIFIKDVSEEFKSTRNVIRDKYRQKALCTLSHELRTPVHSKVQPFKM